MDLTWTPPSPVQYSNNNGKKSAGLRWKVISLFQALCVGFTVSHVMARLTETIMYSQSDLLLSLTITVPRLLTEHKNISQWATVWSKEET